MGIRVRVQGSGVRVQSSLSSFNSSHRHRARNRDRTRQHKFVHRFRRFSQRGFGIPMKDDWKYSHANRVADPRSYPIIPLFSRGTLTKITTINPTDWSPGGGNPSLHAYRSSSFPHSDALNIPESAGCPRRSGANGWRMSDAYAELGIRGMPLPPTFWNRARIYW